MENPEEIMHSLEEFSKMKPKDIPRELEEYLWFVAKTGDPVYQWSLIKSLFREKMIKVITEFYESCHGVDDIPPCPNVEMFNYDVMKNFILEKFDTFIAAPFTVQRICELLTTPRKEYNRIDKYMRALEKNILVVSTMEPGGRRGTENGEGIVNGIESEHSEHIPEASSEINVEEMDDSPSWPRNVQSPHISFESKNGTTENANQVEVQSNSFEALKIIPCTSSTQESVISCSMYEDRLISIEPVSSSSDQSKTDKADKDDEDKNVKEVTITAVHLQPDTEILSVSPEETTQKAEAETTIETKSEEPSETAICENISQEKVEENKDIEVDEGKNDESKTETVSITSESGIENISPETSTSSPENLEVSTSEKLEVPAKAETKLIEKTKEKTESDSENKQAEVVEADDNIAEKTNQSLPHKIDSAEEIQEERSTIVFKVEEAEAAAKVAIETALKSEEIEKPTPAKAQTSEEPPTQEPKEKTVTKEAEEPAEPTPSEEETAMEVESSGS